MSDPIVYTAFRFYFDQSLTLLVQLLLSNNKLIDIVAVDAEAVVTDTLTVINVC